ncbi:MAG: peptidase M14, partial [Bernardetiaceae bacterium]|nr:peptidase M14 [Bernardetiaceae bacterium]
MPQPLPRADFARQLFAQHAQYREPGLDFRRHLKHADLQQRLAKLPTKAGFSQRVLGRSVEGRTIKLVSLGQGPTPVLLWSQMHGDEATATLALLDMFNFFQAQNDGFDSVRQEMLGALTLHFVPMLNPDGAERWIRRNALGIDLNRDAVKLASPESVILKRVRDSLNPVFGFNLHDQRVNYTAQGHLPATISFLAPAYNQAKDLNPVRQRAMQLIGAMSEDLAPLIPGHLAKYNDEHEPRAFGDNIQKWGTSVVLVESGGWPQDPEKQHIRRLNFTSLLAALLAIARQDYARYDLAPYQALPENSLRLRSLIVRGVALPKAKGGPAKVDLAFGRFEKTAANLRDFYYRSEIDDLGDLSNLRGYQDLDGRGLQAVPGKAYPKAVSSKDELLAQDVNQLLGQGYTSVRYLGKEKLGPEPLPGFPLNVLTGTGGPASTIAVESNPDLVFYRGEQVAFAVINGFVRTPGQLTSEGNA